jgi:hypothetical protein
VYSVEGTFTFERPVRVDRTLDLSGAWIVPPFGDAHSHSLDGNEGRDRKAIRRYLTDGVFYVKLPGNFPVSEALKQRYGLNRANGLDVVMAQGAALTATGGHPYRLAREVWLRFGYAKGPVQALDGHRFFTIDSAADLERKWPAILRQRPDFIKTVLWFSGTHEERKRQPEHYGRYGLDPRLLPGIVAKAHAAGLTVSTHVNDAVDFHLAVAAGSDEIAHLPLSGTTAISVADAELAAARGVPVVTTCAIVPTLPSIARADLPKVLEIQRTNLALLRDAGVPLAIGGDDPADTSLAETEYLRKLGVFDNLALLRMWTGVTARTIFPKRKIGELSPGYEASFLALDGNPLEEWRNVRRIRLRFKQGVLLAPD